MDESNRELDRHRREATNRLEKDRTSIAELQIEVSKLRHLLSDKDNQLDDDKKSLLDRLNQEKQTRVKVSKFQKQIFLFSFEPKTLTKLFFEFCPSL